MQDKFGRILVPVEEVIEMKNGGAEVHLERKFFPGYVLVEMVNDDTWHLVKNTPKGQWFVGCVRRRFPEVPTRSCSRCRTALRSPSRKCCLKMVRLCGQGNYDFHGVPVEKLRENRLRVSVTIFGRNAC